MFLGAFERVFKGLQRTGLNGLRLVHVNGFFCGLYISKIKRLDLQSSLLQSGLVTVLFWSRDQTSKHYEILWINSYGFNYQLKWSDKKKTIQHTKQSTEFQ